MQRSRVLLLVDIPTHVKLLVQAAQMLSATGRYEPVFVFGSRAVRDQAGAASPVIARWRSWTWNGNTAYDLAAAAPADGAHASESRPAPDEQAQEEAKHPVYLGSAIWKWPKAAYKALRKPLGLVLPSPHAIIVAYLACQRWAWKLSHVWALVSWSLRMVVLALVVGARTLSGSLHTLARPAGGLEPVRAGIRRVLQAQFRSDWQPGARVRRMLAMSGLGGRAPARVRMMSLQHAAIQAVLDQDAPALMLMPEENMFYGHQLWLQAARERGVRSCVLPFTIVNTLEWGEAFWSVPAFHASRPSNWPVAFAYPNWVYLHRGRRLVLPIEHVLFSEVFGVTPANPWLISSGPADAIAVESGFMDAYYRRVGVPHAKLRLTGTLADDQLHQQLLHRGAARRELLAGLALDEPTRIVLMALPPDQLNGARRDGCEFDGYEALVREMVQATAETMQPGDVLLVNLHPRIDRSRVDFITQMGAHIIDAPIETLVPLADLYIAVVSATIRLAVACGIPVVNYDAYAYRYDDYQDLRGVLEVRSRADYREALRSMLRDPQAYAWVRASQKETAAEQHRIDGHAADRLIGLFDELCARQNLPKAAAAQSATVPANVLR